MIDQFLLHIANSEEPLHLPTTFSTIYAEIVKELKKRFPNLKKPYSLDDDSPEAIAGHFYRHFPTHCLKFFQALITTELDSIKANNTTKIIGWPTVTFIDVSCGSGAASIALLALLENYQRFLVDHNKPISPIEVLLIGLDPGSDILRRYNHVVGKYAASLKPWLIKIQQETYKRAFPQATSRLVQSFKPINSHFVLLGMSNVIRPLGKAFREGRTIIAEQIRHCLDGEDFYKPEFGVAEANALKRIIEEWNLDKLGLLSIVTNNKDKETRRPWHEDLREMIQAIQKIESSHKYESSGIKSRRGFFKNLPGSLFKRDSFNSRYYDNYLSLTNKKYLQDEEWQSIMSPENLELAWARARQNILREALVDEVELRLFDYDIESKLDRLRKQILARNWQSLNLEHSLHFDVPKKPNETRPKAINRIEEQILATAIIQVIGHRAESFQKYSYSYHLSKKRNEFLYEYWLNLWKTFILFTLQKVQARYALRTDIKGFYQNVEQKTLLDIINRKLQINRKTHELLRVLLERDCGEHHEPGKGLPQGHIASGFWADLYLAQVDVMFSSLPGVSFVRYADDMVFAIDGEKEANETQKKLEIILEELEVELSEDKTYSQTGAKYSAENAPDDRLDDFQENRFAPVVNQIFRLDEAYKNLYKKEGWEFIAIYRQLLKSLSIHVSKPWLKRKIEQFWFATVRTLQFPVFPNSSQTRVWVENFRQINSTWLKSLEKLRSDLVNLFFENLNLLKHSGISAPARLIASRRLNFAVNRLCMFGLGEIAELLTDEFIKNPWRFKYADSLCHGLTNSNRLDLILKIIEQTSSPYIKAVALRATARVVSETPTTITQLLFNTLQRDDASPAEKMKASEGLLFMDEWEKVNLSTCQRLIQEEANPYLLKNYILIIGHAFKDSVRTYLLELQEQSKHLIINDAIEYVLRTNLSLFDQNEPDILYSYYSNEYPVTEDELKTQNESPPFIW